MPSNQRTSLILRIVAFVLMVISFALRIARASLGGVALAYTLVPSVVLVGFVLWVSRRAQQARLREAIERNRAVGGVPCIIPPDVQAWGDLVVTPEAYVWEPSKRARAAGHEVVRFDDRGSASTEFHTARVGLRQWPTVTIAAPDREPFTLAMSKASAVRLRGLLAANLGTTPLA